LLARTSWAVSVTREPRHSHCTAEPRDSMWCRSLGCPANRVAKACRRTAWEGGAETAA
jgi:hypothetical protein